MPPVSAKHYGIPFLGAVGPNPFSKRDSAPPVGQVEPLVPKNIDLRVIIPIIPNFGVRKSTKRADNNITNKF